MPARLRSAEWFAGRDELATFSAAPTHAVDAPVRGDGADPPAVPVTPTGDDGKETT